VLSREDVGAILGRLHVLRLKTCLTLIYHCGLRVSEAVQLVPTDIKGKEGHLVVRAGKGRTDRAFPLPPPMSELLRQFWRTHRIPRWVFPSLGSHWLLEIANTDQRLAKATEH